VEWCGGGWQSGSRAVGQGASLLCSAPPDSCTLDEAGLFDDTQGTITHTHHTSHMPSALPWLFTMHLPGNTTTEPERLTAPVVQCESSTHTPTHSLSLSHSHPLSHTLLVTAAPDSTPFGHERAINPTIIIRRLRIRAARQPPQHCSGRLPRVPPSLSPPRLLLHPPNLYVRFRPFPLCPFPSTAGLVSPVHSLVPGPDVFSPSTLAAARRTKADLALLLLLACARRLKEQFSAQILHIAALCVPVPRTRLLHPLSSRHVAFATRPSARDVHASVPAAATCCLATNPRWGFVSRL
jgi:hypothetical protein